MVGHAGALSQACCAAVATAHKERTLLLSATYLYTGQTPLKMGSQDNSEPPSSGPVLPPGFLSIENILNLPSDKVRTGAMVSVIGFVKDFQPPIPTRGTGMLLTLYSSRNHAEVLY